MARESDFERLKRMGMIKTQDDLNKVFVNQTAQNVLVKDNKKGESLKTEVLKKANAARVEFTHNTETFNQTLSSNAAVSYSLTGDSSLTINKNSLVLTNSSLQDLETLKDKAKMAFTKYVIDPSEIREQETVNYLSQNLSSSLHSKDAVLNYFNNKKQPQGMLPDITAANDNLIQRYTTFAESGSNLNNKAAFEALQNTILKDYNDFKNVLEKAVVNSYNFIPYYLMFTGKLNTLAKVSKTPNMEQIKKSAITFLEMLEIARLVMAQAQLSLDPDETKNIDIEVTSAGSSESKLYKDAINNYRSSTQKQIKDFTLSDYENIISNIVNTQPDLFIGKDVSAVAQKLVSSSGTQTDKSVADILYKITNKETGTFREIFIDAKLSGEKGGRYTPSSGISATNTKEILEAIYEPDLWVEASARLNESLGFILYLVLTNNLSASDFKGQFINAIVTYSLLGSKLFIAHYRENLEAGEGFKQPDFLALRPGYIWYSDFFKLMRNVYFEKKGTRSGTKVSFAIKDNLDSLRAPMLQYLDILKNKQKSGNLLEEIGKLGLKNEDIEKFYTVFVQSKVNYGFDFTNVFGALQKMSGSLAKKSLK